MKSVDATRILAFTAGAVLLGSSVAAASMSFGNTQLVDPNGQPTAKIIVGSSAAVSDGVAAANIASVLANHMYKSSTLTASVQGSASCAASGTLSGAGTCQVTDKKATITIELPGVLGNAYQFKTLITDSIDRSLGNRMSALGGEDDYTNDQDVSDISNALSPLRGDSVVGSSTGNLLRIGQDQYTGFTTATITDKQAPSGFSYEESQNFWVGSDEMPAAGDVGFGTAVSYEESSDFRQVVGQVSSLVYNAHFGGNDFGIPVCTNNLDTSGDWTSCADDIDRTDNHRVQIKFMGGDWVISEMTEPGAAPDAASGVKAGGEVKLAKEAKYDIINVGGEIDGGTFKVRLADISVATGAENNHPAILDILDSNGAVVGQIQVNPGTTYTYTQSSTGKSILVHVYKTAPGFTLNAKWAEIAIYTDEIKLEDGKRYDNAGSSDANWKYVYASLLWKDRDGGAESDTLRDIVLYVDNVQDYMGGSDQMVAGDSVSFPKVNSAYKLTYNGLDLSPDDYSSLTLQSKKVTNIRVAMDNTACASDDDHYTYTGTVIKVNSDTDGAFGGTADDALETDQVSEVLIDPTGAGNGADIDEAIVQDATLTGAGGWLDSDAAYTGTMLYWRPSNCDLYKSQIQDGLTELDDTDPDFGTAVLDSFASSGPTGADGFGSAVKFEAAGPDSAALGAVRWQFTSGNDQFLDNTGVYPATFGDDIVGEIVVQEDAGKSNTASHYPVAVRFPVYPFSSNNWRFKPEDATTSVAFYQALTVDPGLPITDYTEGAAAGSYDLPTLYTERGSKVTDVSKTSVSMQEAKKVGMPSFTFAAADNTMASSGSDWIASVGDSKTLPDGAKLTLKAIDQTVGSCVAGPSGAAPTCTVDSSGVSARIMPDNQASVQAVQPYTLQGSLVMTDAQAANAGGVIISVGGPAVNTVTASALKDANVDWKANAVLVKGYGNTLVVAGATAADTMTAAQDFISQLTSS